MCRAVTVDHGELIDKLRDESEIGGFLLSVSVVKVAVKTGGTKQAGL